jgi:hypothetical protein
MHKWKINKSLKKEGWHYTTEKTEMAIMDLHIMLCEHRSITWPMGKIGPCQKKKSVHKYKTRVRLNSTV